VQAQLRVREAQTGLGADVTTDYHRSWYVVNKNN